MPSPTRSGLKIWQCRQPPMRCGRRCKAPNRARLLKGDIDVRFRFPSSHHGSPGGRPVGAQSGSQVAGRRPFADPGYEATVGSAVGAHRPFASRRHGGRRTEGALGRHRRHDDAANSPVLQQALPGLAMVPNSIGDPQVRNRGTIGGSIANNDPNADYPAACLGLGATIITNKRRIAADDFFTGMFTTTLEDGEIITKVSFPIAKKAAYEKFKHPASGFALVGVFVSKRGSEIRVAVTGAGANGVFRVKSFEEALKKRFAAKSLEGMTIPATGMNSDIHASAEYRAHLVGVLARRALAKATV